MRGVCSMCVVCSKAMGGYSIFAGRTKEVISWPPERLCRCPRAELYLLLWFICLNPLGFAVSMSLFALVGLCLKHPVCLWLSCRTFPSVGRRKLFLPLVRFIAKWFISIAASCRFHAPEFHSTRVCPTPSSPFTLSQGRNTPQRGRVEMGRDRFLATGLNPSSCTITWYHWLQIIEEILWVFYNARCFLSASDLCEELWNVS